MLNKISSAFKFNLALKGLIVIAVPAMLQLSFLMSFNELLVKAEFFEQNQYHSKFVIGRTNWLSTLLVTMNFAWLGYLETGDAKMRAIYTFCGASLKEELNEIERLSKNDPSLLLQAERFKAQIDTLCQVLRANENTVDGGQRAQLLKNKVLPIWQNLYDVRRQLLAAENARDVVDESTIPRFRAQQRSFVGFGLILTLLIAAVLFYIYTRTITSRLALLADNARLFAARKTTHEPLKGVDEVAQLDKELHGMMNELILAEKRKQEYVQMISHDLKTPLTTVLGSLYLISAQSGLSEDARPILDQAERNLQRLLQLINQLLQMERMQGGMITPDFAVVPVSTIVDRAFDAVLTQADQQEVKLKQINTANINVFADEELLIQVLVNLLGNALKFSVGPNEILVQIIDTQEFVEFMIIDKGRGIPPPHIDSIFDRFYQVEKADATKKGGSGLGLAICKAIVEAHKGTIGVNSTEGEGSTFWFKIPKQKPV